MKTRARHHGFTLLELILVMFIVILAVGAIGINIGKDNPSGAIKTVARDLGSALRYARGQALISRKPAWVEINLAENHYRISGRDKKYAFSDQINVTMTIAEENHHNQEAGRILFYPDGSSSGGRIDLEWDGFSRRIDVNWLNGRVSLNDETE